MVGPLILKPQSEQEVKHEMRALRLASSNARFHRLQKMLANFFPRKNKYFTISPMTLTILLIAMAIDHILLDL